ncbi:hypothetical protein CXB51_031305 [Gossypium anomalum]|uniref:Retrotransposon gag protein n=1 Tax=Gossypium anomalum TaxID=47600 RepID=A0A8J5YBQ0_9ROSI|nr:hypothetical protein CXB51_031305 [Gossypium anomalum]
MAQTIRQLAEALAEQPPLCITYPTMDPNFELKSGLIQLLPTFRGLQNENPHKHLKEFHMFYLSMKPQGVFFSVACSRVKKRNHENKANRRRVSSLPQYFYEGLKHMEMNMVDAASGGALVNMTPQQARDLISTMATNSQQFQANPEPPRGVHRLSNSTLEDKVDRLTNMMNSLIVEKAKKTQLCGICATLEHTTDACPSLNDDTMAHLDAVGNFLGPPQRRYDPYANTYNPGWRDYPKLSYGANLRYNQSNQNRFPQQPLDSGNSLEIMVNKLAANVLDFQQQTLNFQRETNGFQQKTEASIRGVTISIKKLNSQGKLPSQTEPNPRQNANVVTL